MIPQEVSTIMDELNSAGFQAYVVGGAVRDLALGIEPNDYDVATDATPSEVETLFGAAVQSTDNSRQHGTVFVYGIDVTTFRTDHDEDGFSARIEFASSILDDVSRRDFTFNGMAMLPNGEVYDPFNGQGDLENRMVRAIGDPRSRICESYVRMLRACRFMALHEEMVMDPELAFAIRRESGSMLYVPAELIQHELMRMLSYPAPLNGLRAMYNTGLLIEILPELALCENVSQENCHLHQFDVLEHSFLVMSALPMAQPLLRLAGLLHDVGKGTTRTVDASGAVHFYGHETASVGIARNMLVRLHFSNADIQYVTTVIREHMALCAYRRPTIDRGVRRLMARLGEIVSIEDILELSNADRFGRAGVANQHPHLESILESVGRIRQDNNALQITDLVIGGHALIEMGYTPGPGFGRVLRALLEEVLDMPSLNNRTYLLDRAQELMEEGCEA